MGAVIAKLRGFCLLSDISHQELARFIERIASQPIAILTNFHFDARFQLASMLGDFRA